MSLIAVRPVPQRERLMLEQAGIHPLLARLYAARGIRSAEELDTRLQSLLPPDSMKGVATAAKLLGDALAGGRKILIVADYDCDGATACAVGLRALRMLGARPDTVDYLVPNRFETGYGLSPEVARLAAHHPRLGKPELLVTVDNGIASVAGVAAAQQLGMTVIVTDHHLPGDELPAAAAIVNPNQPGCHFPSKHLAGVGAMFYTMLATRAELRKRGAFGDGSGPNLATLLDLVALGTVADVVPLDRNNRVLVGQGLARIRAGRAVPGIAALLQIAGRAAERAGSFDLGFAIGPRLNAAGRLADMSLGIECLMTDDIGRARNLASELDQINSERRSIEADMLDQAALHLDGIDASDRASLSLFDPEWHQGVIGILAGRIKDKLHRPTFVFARGEPGELKGSGRSIPGLHLRDALDLVAKRHPQTIRRFGGHAAAAGLTLREDDLAAFTAAFEKVARSLLDPAVLSRTIESDGPLEAGYYGLASVRLLQGEIWGQGIPLPVFSDCFEVVQQRILKEKHLKLTLKKDKARLEAIRFNHAGNAPDRIHAAFRVDINTWQGEDRVQLLLEDFEPA